MKRKIFQVLFLLVVFSTSTLAQKTVSGVVTDDTGNPLPGANVTIVGTMQGTITDQNGYYRAMIGDKLVNYASEINRKLDPSFFKQLVSGEPIEARLPYTLALLGTGISLGTIMGIAIGTLSAAKHGTIWDTLITAFISLSMATPIFWLALIPKEIFLNRTRSP